MLYKELLGRLGHPLNEAEEGWKAERKNDKKKKVAGQRISQSEDQAVDSESDGEEEDQQVMIDWALEWWRKPGAPIVT
jgi:U3 small nucleolar RNA-associated protein 14